MHDDAKKTTRIGSWFNGSSTLWSIHCAGQCAIDVTHGSARMWTDRYTSNANCRAAATAEAEEAAASASSVCAAWDKKKGKKVTNFRRNGPLSWKRYSVCSWKIYLKHSQSASASGGLRLPFPTQASPQLTTRSGKRHELPSGVGAEPSRKRISVHSKTHKMLLVEMSVVN